MLVGLPFTERPHCLGLQPDQPEPLGAEDSYDGVGFTYTSSSECVLLLEHCSFCCYLHTHSLDRRLQCHVFSLMISPLSPGTRRAVDVYFFEGASRCSAGQISMSGMRAAILFGYDKVLKYTHRSLYYTINNRTRHKASLRSQVPTLPNIFK